MSVLAFFIYKTAKFKTNPINEIPLPKCQNPYIQILASTQGGYLEQCFKLENYKGWSRIQY